MDYCICGPERAGTTAVVTLFKTGARLSALVDPFDAVRASFTLLAGKQLDGELQAAIRQHSIVKVPSFAVVLPQLHQQFGDFEVICMVRDPRDCVASVVERASKGVRGPKVDTFWMPHSTGTPDKNIVRGAALRWTEAMAGATAYEAGGGIVNWLKYEDFVNDKVGTLADIAEELGLEFSPTRCGDLGRFQWNKHLRPREPRPIWGPGRWAERLNANEIALVEKICRAQMAEWGYES